tara:strand:- start:4907 stop:6232 length:1326 start_codon:yes stop_codon:yes gene_type:complete
MQMLKKFFNQVRTLYSHMRTTYDIVWSFRGIFLALFGPLRRLPEDVDYLFICHDVHRHSQLDGKLYAPLIDPIFQELSQFGRCLTLAAPFSRLRGDNCFGDVRVSNFNVLLALLKRVLVRKSPKLLRIEGDPLVNAYLGLLSQLRPNVIIGIQPSIELCCAARKLDITVYDMQHGVISDVNYYSIVKRQQFDQVGWPDAVLCWDKVSADRVKKISSGHVKSRIIGNPAYHSKYGLRMKSHHRSGKTLNQEYKENILITLTYQDFDSRISYLRNFSDKFFVGIGIPKQLVDLINNSPQIFWRIRLHPVQTKFNQQEVHEFLDRTFVRSENIDWINFSAVPLSAALFECSGHITVDSAASVDAAQNGVPTLLVSCPGWSDKAKVYDYFGEYIAADIMKFTEASELSSRSLDFFTEKGAGSKSDSNSDSETAFRKFIESVRATG